MGSHDGSSLEDLAHAPGSGIPDRHLPERNPDTFAASHDLRAELDRLLTGHPVRVILNGDFSKVSAAVQSSCLGFAGPADVEDLARAALALAAHGGYAVHLYPRHRSSDAALVVKPVPGKPPRTDLSLETCVRALSGGD